MDDRPADVGLYLLAIVKGRPGIHFRELARAAHLRSVGQLRHHVDRLERQGLLVEVEDGRYKRFFAAGDHSPELRPGLARFSRLVPRRIGRLLLVRPMNRAELRRRVGCADSTLGYHLNRMLVLGDVEKRRSRAGCHYALTDREHVRRVLTQPGVLTQAPLPTSRPWPSTRSFPAPDLQTLTVEEPMVPAPPPAYPAPPMRTVPLADAALAAPLEYPRPTVPPAVSSAATTNLQAAPAPGPVPPPSAVGPGAPSATPAAGPAPQTPQAVADPEQALGLPGLAPPQSEQAGASMPPRHPPTPEAPPPATAPTTADEPATPPET